MLPTSGSEYVPSSCALRWRCQRDTGQSYSHVAARCGRRIQPATNPASETLAARTANGSGNTGNGGGPTARITSETFVRSRASPDGDSWGTAKQRSSDEVRYAIPCLNVVLPLGVDISVSTYRRAVDDGQKTQGPVVGYSRSDSKTPQLWKSTSNGQYGQPRLDHAPTRAAAVQASRPLRC